MTGLLRLGSKGEDVSFLQASLNQLASLPGRRSRYPFLEVDAIFGAKTRARVLEFQTASKLTVDGIVGPQTLGTLTELLATAPFSSQAAAGGAGAGVGKGAGGAGGLKGSASHKASQGTLKWLGGRGGGSGGGGKFMKAPRKL